MVQFHIESVVQLVLDLIQEQRQLKSQQMGLTELISSESVHV